jgi:multidrug efflux pump subunit AcrA (membrane-fusion protein)
MLEVVEPRVATSVRFASRLVAMATVLLVAGISPIAWAQSEPKAALPEAKPGDQVVVKREALRLLDPQRYRANLRLDAYQRVELTAPFDGVIRQVQTKPNAKVAVQVELMRLENTVQRLNLQKAQKMFQAADLELKNVSVKPGDGQDPEVATQIATARRDAAKLDVELAQFYLDQTSIRAPFAGDVQRVQVVDGQYVRAGDPLLIMGDSSKLMVEVPAERAIVEREKAVTLKIEDKEVTGKVEALLTLDPRFDHLRELFDSITSAIVVIDNSEGKFRPGQTVYAPIVPRQPVTEVSTGAIGNVTGGNRRVQVLRTGVVRDIIVNVMGAVGFNRVYVSGPFQEGDEAIIESSHLLADGFPLRPAAAGAPGPGAAARPGATPTPPTGTTPPGDF